ncbi:hypothetical protein EBU91_00600, partial [bacterium]|nr:hypothetical protein [bacterium]
SIIGVILLFVYVIFTSIVSTFSSSNSEAARESNISYTYGTISGSAISLVIEPGSLDSTGCGVLEAGGGAWDNISRNEFLDLKVTSRNCRVICNMAKAVSSLQRGSHVCSRGAVNCNPNFYNSFYGKYGASSAYECSGRFNYFACNYLTHAAYYTPGNVVDPDIRSYVTWDQQWPYWYCVGKPVPMGNVYGGETNEQLINNIIGAPICVAIKDKLEYTSTEELLTKYIMIPLKTQDNSRKNLCVSKSNLDPGDVLMWGWNACEWPIVSGAHHIGLILNVTDNALITAEANMPQKSYTYQLIPCEGAVTYDENGNEIPADDGVQIVLSGSLGASLCRMFKPAVDDPSCPTDGSAFTCPRIVSGTPGFMRD